MENMDKGLAVQKRVLIVWLKIPQMPQNLSGQFVCPSPKVLDFNEKSLHWASIVCASYLRFISISFLMHMFSCCPQMQKRIQLH